MARGPRNRDRVRRRGAGYFSTLVCRYQGVRTAGDTSIRYTAAADPLTGECRPIDETEHYDLAADPFQLDNLFPADPGPPEAAIEDTLDARLERLRDCEGIPGRDPFRRGTSTASDGRRARPSDRPSGHGVGSGQHHGIETLTLDGRRRGRGALRAGRRDGRLLAAARW